MLRVFPRTREREKSWKLGGICFGGALVGAPFVSLIFRRKDTDLMEVGSMLNNQHTDANRTQRSFGAFQLYSSLSAFYHSFFYYVKPRYRMYILELFLPYSYNLTCSHSYPKEYIGCMNSGHMLYVPAQRTWTDRLSLTLDSPQDCHRLVLPCDFRLLSGVLYLELDLYFGNGASL